MCEETMDRTPIMFPDVVTRVDGARDVIVIVVAASREDDSGARVPITEAQKETAMNAAKSVLQCVGATVDANSTSFLLPAEGEGSTKYTIRVDAVRDEV